MEEKNQQEQRGGQVYCVVCNCAKMQLIFVTEYKEGMLLDLICQECGALQNLKFSGKLKSYQPEQTKSSSEKLSYLG